MGFWLPVASLVAEQGLQGMQASVAGAHGLSSCSSQALDCRLKSWGHRLSCSGARQDLSGSGIQPLSPALAGSQRSFYFGSGHLFLWLLVLKGCGNYHPKYICKWYIILNIISGSCSQVWITCEANQDNPLMSLGREKPAVDFYLPHRRLLNIDERSSLIFSYF